MARIRLLAALAACLILARLAAAGGEAPNVSTAHGTVDKVEKDTLRVKTRLPDGKFGKTLTLKVTGTSKFTTLSQRQQAGKAVLVQRDADAKDLQPNQPITVIYATGASGPVLLSAVVQPAAGK
jgi:hypothetical protein